MNKFSYLWDGPGVYIKDFLNELSKVSEFLIDKEKMKILFKMREESFILNAYSEYVKGYSVLGSNVR